MSAHADKARLRLQARSARQGIPAEDRPQLDLAACERALELPQLQRAHHALGFAAAPEELDPAGLLEALQARGVSVCLPRISGPGSLTLHSCTPGAPLEEGPFGLRQPSETAPTVFADGIDLVIVPGVAFDAHGRRLGFGGGYYDRLLASMPHAFRLSLAYDGQLLSDIPAEEHDESVDAIVTPTRVIVVEPHRKG